MGLPEGSPSFFAFFAQWRPSRSFTPVAPSCPCARLPAFCTPSCPRPCNRRNASSFSMSLHAGGLPSAHLVSFSMSLQTSAWGPCKGVPFAGREAPRERCSPGGLRAAGSMADFGATRGVAIRVPAGAGDSVQYFGQIRSAFRIRLKCYSLLCPTAGEADCHVASLLAMTCRRLLPVRIAPGYCRKAPLPRRRVSVFSMSLHAGWLLSAHLASFQHVIANQCAHWCGNPRPRRSRKQCTVLWANSQRLSYSP